MIQGLTTAAALAPFGTAAKAALPRVVEQVAERLRAVPLDQCEIGGPLAERFDVNATGRLMRVDLDRLLGAFVHKDGEPVEDAIWLGEHAGKFLDAACRTLRHRHDPALRKRVDRAASTLIAAQQADGYLGTYPDAKRWTGWDVWTHQYNLMGLLAYHELTGAPDALASGARIGDLLCRTFGDGPEQRDIVRSGEHRGMAATSVLESMCRLYRATSDARYLAFCRYIVAAYEHEGGSRIVTALLDHGSVHRVANGKAYEMLLNLVGLVDLHRLTGEADLLRAVLRGWEDIVAHQLYASGTASMAEHFQTPGQLFSLPASRVGETCVTVTWLELNWRLLKLTGEARFGEEIERTIFNQLLAAQDAQSGDFCYYTSYCGPKPYRSGILCCVSSGPRGIAMLPELTWAQDDRSISLNLYMAGRTKLSIGGADVTLVQETAFPRSGAVTLTLDCSRPARFALRLRVPRWTADYAAVIGGKRYVGVPGEWLVIERQWAGTEIVAIMMEMTVRTVPGAPSYPDRVGVMRGPQLLSLDTALNPTLPSIHRVVLADADRPAVTEDPAGYRAAIATSDDVPATALLVPFADCREGMAWLRRTARGTPRTPISKALLCDAGVSHVYDPPAGTNMLAPPPLGLLEALTDDDPARYCTVRPSDADMAAAFGRPREGEPRTVWFAVLLPRAMPVRQVRFTHGAIDAAGGWFDSREALPRVQLLRQAPGVMYGILTDFYGPGWETVGTLDDYPATTSALLAGWDAARSFTLDIADDRPAFAVRVVGECAGTHVNCGELAVY